jgi:trimeric autotransporter adhesin
MTYEVELPGQAEMEKFSRSTFSERKIMSTKTSIKRIAAVAAVALTLGGFSAVSAHATTASTVTAVGSTGGTVGIGQTFATTFTGVVGAADTGGVTVALTVPTSSSVTLAKRDGSSTSVYSTSGASSDLNSPVMSTSTGAVTYSAPVAGGTDAYGTLTVIPDVAGTYTFTITGASSTSKTITVVAVSAPTFVGGTGQTVTTASAIKQVVGGIATYNIVSDAADTAYQISATGQTILSAYTTTSAGYKLTSAGAAAALLTSGTTGLTYANATNAQGGFTFTPGSNAGIAYVQVQVQSTTAGVGTLTVTPLSASGVPGTSVSSLTTWGSAAVLTPTLSYVRQQATSATGDATTATAPGSGYPSTDATIVASKTAGTNASTIEVILLNNDLTGAQQSNKISASVTGSGLITVDQTSTVEAGTVRSASVTTAAGTNVAWVHVSSDGSAGTGTVTISVTDAITGVTTTIGTKTQIYTGSVAAIKVASSNYTIGAPGKSSGMNSSGAPYATRVPTSEVGDAFGTNTTTVDTAPAFVVLTTDGTNPANIASSGVPTISSSDATVVTGGTCVQDTTSTTNVALIGQGGAVGYYNCGFTTAIGAVSGATATLTIKTPSTTAGVNLTATYVVTVGGKTPGTETITSDSATYAPGQQMLVTITCKDVSGNPCADGTASPAVTTSAALASGGNTALAAGFYNGGVNANATSVAKSSTFAPVIETAFNLKATSGNAAATALSVPLSTANGATTTAAAASTAAAQAAVDAANEATDAANAATDAANNAMDSADAAQQAALDAGDKADAALAAVTDLATKVSAIASQIASLSALVKKIATKVKA